MASPLAHRREPKDKDGFGTSTKDVSSLSPLPVQVIEMHRQRSMARSRAQAVLSVSQSLRISDALPVDRAAVPAIACEMQIHAAGSPPATPRPIDRDASASVRDSNRLPLPAVLEPDQWLDR